VEEVWKMWWKVGGSAALLFTIHFSSFIKPFAFYVPRIALVYPSVCPSPGRALLSLAEK
jgi:hypothetical protein